MITIVFLGCKKTTPPICGSVIKSHIDYTWYADINYLRYSAIPKNSKPLAIRRQYSKDFVLNEYSHWELEFENGLRSEVLTSWGESKLAKIQHERIYETWIVLQEKLWELPYPKIKAPLGPLRYRLFFRNLYTYHWGVLCTPSDSIDKPIQHE